MYRVTSVGAPSITTWGTYIDVLALATIKVAVAITSSNFVLSITLWPRLFLPLFYVKAKILLA